MSSQTNSKRLTRKHHFWTPPTAAQREAVAGSDRAHLNRIRPEDLEEYGDAARWMAVCAMVIELSDNSVSIVQRQGPPTAPIEIPRNMIGNEHELEDLAVADHEVVLLVQRPFALRRRLL